jgi:hypothetical protein
MEPQVGFIHDKFEIKILLLFILRRLPEPVTFEMLSELALIDEGISYFDFAECVTELQETGHIETDGHTYFITEKGVKNSEITENSLPFTVRLKAEKNAADARLALSRNSHISAGRTILRKGGYSVELSLSDGVGDILSMRLYAASQEQAIALENGFTKKAESIYNAIIRLILDES